MDIVTFGSVRFIPGDNSGKYPFCHSLFIEANRRILIDPAANREVLTALRDNPGVDEIWLSHPHEDHFLHLDLFDDLPLGISERDAGTLSSMDAFLDSYDITDEKTRVAWRDIMLTYFRFRPRTPQRVFRGGGLVDLGGTTVEIIPTPGHTQGHLSFFTREEGVLFIGDYDLTPFPYYGDRDSDIDQTIASIHKLREVEAKVWISPHDRGIYRENPDRLWDQFLAIIDNREAQLLALLEEPRTMTDIVGAHIIYKRAREPKIFYEFGELSMMKKHLDRLMARGVVKKEGDYYFISKQA